MSRTALVTGIGGQDGYYLAKYLLSKGYKVVGVARRSSLPNLARLDDIINQITVIEGDVSDYSSMLAIVIKYAPDEIYNLAAQSHVHTSFEQPLYTWRTNAEGCLNLLDIIRLVNPSIRFLQASTSEMFGSSVNNVGVQDENTTFVPQSPYAISKVAAHQSVGLYRRAYGLHASCSICFNHESPKRGDNFVTRKITKYIGQLVAGKTYEPLKLGNLHAYRDWSFAGDMVEAMHTIVSQNEPDDYVVSSGQTNSVSEFLDMAFSLVSLDYRDYVELDQSLIRPAEVEYLRGDNSKIKKLGWEPKINFTQLVKMMVDNDLDQAGSEAR